MSLGTRLYDGLLLDVLQPLCIWSPRWLWPLLAWGLALAGAPWVALSRAQVLDPVLRVSGRAAGLRGRWWLGRAMLYRRLRRLDIYLCRKPGPWRLVWDGEPPDQRPACYVVMDTLGAEQVAAWADRDAFIFVRRRFGREDPDAPDAPPWQSRWLEHCDRLRGALGRQRVVDPTAGVSELRRLYRSGGNLLFFQGSPSPDPSVARLWLGRRLPIALGAVRIARRESLPLRYVQLRPSLTGWVITIDAPTEPDEAWLLARMERELRECPQGWALWPDFWAAVARQDAAADPRPPGQEAPAHERSAGRA